MSMWTQDRKLRELSTKNTLKDLPPDLRPVLKPGERECLKCGQSFNSWCRTRNRLCNNCHYTNSSVMEEGI